MMHPYILQALVATRIAELNREAEAAHLGVKRAGKWARRWERMQPARRAVPAGRPERAGFGSA
jgi:hypothetical protein